MPALQFTYFKQTVRALSGGDEEVFKQWHQEFFPLSTKIERNWQGESTVFTTAWGTFQQNPAADLLFLKENCLSVLGLLAFQPDWVWGPWRPVELLQHQNYFTPNALLQKGKNKGEKQLVFFKTPSNTGTIFCPSNLMVSPEKCHVPKTCQQQDDCMDRLRIYPLLLPAEKTRTICTLEDYTYRQQFHDQLFNADKKSVHCDFLKSSRLPFSSKPKFVRCTKLILFLSSWKLTESHLVNSFCFFFHWQTKGKDEICYWVLPPKNKDKQSPRKISLPETKQKKLLKLLIVFFWKFNVGALQTLLHQEAREKVVEKIISNKGFKIKLFKMRICLFNPKTWDFDPKSALKFGGKRWDFVSKGKLNSFWRHLESRNFEPTN